MVLLLHSGTIMKCNLIATSFTFRSCSSAAHRGRNYELHTINVLRQLGFHLNHCGGAHDKGVDFRGYWHMSINKEKTRLNVVGDCKNLKVSCGPLHIRSLIGTLDREPRNTIGILVSRKGFTKDAHKTFKSSHLPMALISINDADSSDGGRLLRYFDRNPKCHQLTPNITVASKFYEGLRFFEILLHDQHGNVALLDSL
ncbi:Uncharacterized protein C824.03c, mitochondrial [Trichoplax sp. H2]|uniref:Restriction endonuclease type IV Mrr domain-containing protein n=1 Tax=Trichoplax adhaerens TaxID=10228 RepID=B3RM13_TRIAD|nr:hypothetical protein TRIADDRAFT_52196 [Trichoplax adhaerens]EDV29618.1 hypothetical protein TRIADDRAFT_52196 [Trichoplax adhaerens]RDD46611.1 Uncharacterized protein C824.03c, mitochondrial [Trichoplax sp. H2]|eukprot:XP_002108820.1 hypothetical protein TRIADDRAFT_52196 [Trichoplax adhaerens]